MQKITNVVLVYLLKNVQLLIICYYLIIVLFFGKLNL